MTMSEMSRTAKCVLWVAARWAELREKGLVEGGLPITIKGLATVDQLDAEGFWPTTDEIDRALAALKRYCMEKGS